MVRIAKKFGALTAVAVVAGVLLVSPTASYAASAGTCSGGSVTAGTYSALTITGACTVDAGTVNVTRNLTVAPGGELIAAFGGSDVHVGGNVMVGANGVLILGCEPEAFTCVNDTPPGTMITHDTVGGNVISQGALAVIVHATTIDGNSITQGGGGGVTCGSSIPNVPGGSPAYIDFEDNTIGGNSIIQGVQSCWAGYIRNHVSGNVIYQRNMFADPDASELTTNNVGRNMICFGNNPQVQFGDSHGTPNVIGGKALGECTAVA